MPDASTSNSIWAGITPLSYATRGTEPDQLDRDIRNADRCSQAVADRIAALRARRPEEGSVPLINSKARATVSVAPVVFHVPTPIAEHSRTAGRPRIAARNVAVANGYRTYVGGVHTLCGTALRYTKGGACVQCAKQAASLERQRRDADGVLRQRTERAEKKLLAQAMRKQLQTALKLAEAAVKAQHQKDIDRTWRGLIDGPTN